jgi:hypothetical protein
MVQILLVAVGAGMAAALTAIGMILIPLAPLPILIAAIGWGHLVGLLAAVIASAIVGLIYGVEYSVIFLLGVGLPAWWLAYLSLLARPAGANGSGTAEWYPVGRLVFSAAAIGALLVAVAMLGAGTDVASSFQSDMRSAMTQGLAVLTKSTPETVDPRMVDAMVRAVPPGVAVLLTILYTFNLWAAGRIVDISGRLRRPWPDLSEMTLPRFTPGVLAAAIAGAFLPDLPGVLSRVLISCLLMAYGLMGLAVLHAITRGAPGRSFVLGCVYFAVIVLSWTMLAIALLGLAETAFNIRARFASPAARPPTKPT